MNQNNIRQHNGTTFTVPEAAAWLKELDDRTKSSETGYNSINELAAKVKTNEAIYKNGITTLTPLDARNVFSGGVTGSIKITLPNSWTNTMIKLYVEIYDYTTNESISLIVSGYTPTAVNHINTLKYHCHR